MDAVAELLPGVMLVRLEPREDERGFFTRAFCRGRLASLGIEASVEQANLSYSRRRHTLRGLHYQLPPSDETKLVYCVRGAIHDVVLDLRDSSPSFGRWAACALSETSHQMIVVPPGCAHGFLTLTDDTLAFYLVSRAYDPARERGIRWNDPAFAIEWPFRPAVLSTRDRTHRDFDRTWHLAEPMHQELAE